MAELLETSRGDLDGRSLRSLLDHRAVVELVETSGVISTGGRCAPCSITERGSVVELLDGSARALGSITERAPRPPVRK